MKVDEILVYLTIDLDQLTKISETRTNKSIAFADFVLIQRDLKDNNLKIEI